MNAHLYNINYDTCGFEIVNCNNAYVLSFIFCKFCKMSIVYLPVIMVIIVRGRKVSWLSRLLRQF